MAFMKGLENSSFYFTALDRKLAGLPAGLLNCIGPNHSISGESPLMPRAISALIVAVFLSLTVAAQDNTWQIDPRHSAAQFSVRHLGISTVRGAFTKVSGSVQYDPANLGKTSIQATIEAASIDTRVDMRDNDLRSPNYFDVQKYPAITFQSKRVEPAGAGKLKVIGDLTIHGVTKEVVLDVDGPSATSKIPGATSAWALPPPRKSTAWISAWPAAPAKSATKSPSRSISR